MKFEEIYAHMAAEYKTLAGVEPEDAADISIRLKVLAGELYTVLCAAESLKLNCFPQTAAGEALDLHAEERGLVRKDAVKSVGTLTFSRRTALSYAAEIPAGTVPRANGVNTVAVYLYGDNGAVTDEVLGKVGETLEKLKEISVDVTVAAAVAVKKPVTVYVKPKDGCAFEDAKALCTAAITAYLNAFEVGEPFVTAGLIHAVMETGIAQNCTVPASVADFTPNAGEIVTAGAVNVLETQ